MSPSPDERGFTLIEALVALTILAIASVGLMRATQSHIDAVRGLQLRAMSQWLAENRMAELHVGAVQAPGPTEVEMLGQAFAVETTTRQTDDPDLAAVKISVRPSGAMRPYASLDGFMDVGADP